MLPHHAGVYQHLQSQFPGADVYISTSDKVEGTKIKGFEILGSTGMEYPLIKLYKQKYHT